MRKFIVFGLALFAAGAARAGCDEDQMDAALLCNLIKNYSDITKITCASLDCSCERNAISTVKDALACLNLPNNFRCDIAECNRLERLHEETIANYSRVIEELARDCPNTTWGAAKTIMEKWLERAPVMHKQIQLDGAIYGRDNYDAFRSPYPYRFCPVEDLKRTKGESFYNADCLTTIKDLGGVTRYNLALIDFVRSNKQRILRDALNCPGSSSNSNGCGGERGHKPMSDFGRNCRSEFVTSGPGAEPSIKATDAQACPYIYWKTSGTCVEGCSEVRCPSYCIYTTTDQLKTFAKNCARELLGQLSKSDAANSEEPDWILPQNTSIEMAMPIFRKLPSV
ncbi:MAG: hypothetical protein LBQ49_02435 [Rickettsiales bacterium]|jgi:hypothetical protein|nr:hypothetical protein [Rickettsiales bacterium]